jgi:hypothetical protein
MTYRSDLTHAACEATISLDKALLLFARELEAHKELIEKLETQILNLQAREMVADASNDYNIESRFDRIETRLDQVECSIETGITYSDIDERFTEALQNVTFTVSVD